MNFVYDFVAGSSRITPFGVIIAGAVTVALVRAGQEAFAGIALVAILLATLFAGVFEKEREKPKGA